MFRILIAVLMAVSAQSAVAEVIELVPTQIAIEKSVYGEVEPRDLIPARARIGGTLVALGVSAGDRVTEGQSIGRVEDDKLNFQLDAIDAQLGALETQLSTAASDLERGLSLSERGVITTQRLEQLQTAVHVLENQIKSAQAERLVVEQRVAEGDVLSPVSGVVLSVPVARGSVINPGEAIAQVAGGGVFLRLALPERYAGLLTAGEQISIGFGSDVQTGNLIKIYPQIAGGRVLADVEVSGLDDRFIGRRIPVHLPVGQAEALLVPEAAITRHGGLDFVTIVDADHGVQRVVVPGRTIVRDGAAWVEILSGLSVGDKVQVSHD